MDDPPQTQPGLHKRPGFFWARAAGAKIANVTHIAHGRGGAKFTKLTLASYSTRGSERDARDRQYERAGTRLAQYQACRTGVIAWAFEATYPITMIRPAISESNRSAVHALARRYRAANPRLFGSMLHGRATAESDIDILVDALPGATLFDLGGLQVELEALFGVPVDLLTPADLPVRFRDSVLAEARPI